MSLFDSSRPTPIDVRGDVKLGNYYSAPPLGVMDLSRVGLDPICSCDSFDEILFKVSRVYTVESRSTSSGESTVSYFDLKRMLYETAANLYNAVGRQNAIDRPDLAIRVDRARSREPKLRIVTRQLSSREYRNRREAASRSGSVVGSGGSTQSSTIQYFFFLHN